MYGCSMAALWWWWLVIGRGGDSRYGGASVMSMIVVVVWRRRWALWNRGSRCGQGQSRFGDALTIYEKSHHIINGDSYRVAVEDGDDGGAVINGGGVHNKWLKESRKEFCSWNSLREKSRSNLYQI